MLPAGDAVPLDLWKEAPACETSVHERAVLPEMPIAVPR